MNLLRWTRNSMGRMYRMWPIAIGWRRRSSDVILTWHGWTEHPTAVNHRGQQWHGWTFHCGALKVYFGHRSGHN